jgi:phage gp36-like protein
MMISIQDLKDYLGSKEELLLSKLVDADIEALITEQSAVISDILHEIPEETPVLLKKICKDFCKHQLYMRESRQDVPESVEKQYENGMKLLNKILKKEITFGTDKDPSEDDLQAVYSVRKQYFDRKL